MTATLAPDASIVAYESPANNPGLIDSMTAIVTANTAKVISMSLGECEADAEGGSPSSFATSMHEILMEAASQGQSVMAATGDQGSEACFPYFSSGSLVASGTGLDPSYPASDPLVTAVGGTVLSRRYRACLERLQRDGQHLVCRGPCPGGRRRLPTGPAAVVCRSCSRRAQPVSQC